MRLSIVNNLITIASYFHFKDIIKIKANLYITFVNKWEKNEWKMEKKGTRKKKKKVKTLTVATRLGQHM